MKNNMETVGFTRETAAEARSLRDAQYEEWRAEGSEGLAKYTTHMADANGKMNPAIVYAVTRRMPDPAVLPEVPVCGQTLVPLTEPAADDMIAEGGNTDDNPEGMAEETRPVPSE